LGELQTTHIQVERGWEGERRVRGSTTDHSHPSRERMGGREEGEREYYRPLTSKLREEGRERGGREGGMQRGRKAWRRERGRKVWRRERGRKAWRMGGRGLEVDRKKTRKMTVQQTKN
jgi:hypothetical protein